MLWSSREINLWKSFDLLRGSNLRPLAPSAGCSTARPPELTVYTLLHQVAYKYSSVLIQSLIWMCETVSHGIKPVLTRMFPFLIPYYKSSCAVLNSLYIRRGMWCHIILRQHCPVEKSWANSLDLKPTSVEMKPYTPVGVIVVIEIH